VNHVADKTTVIISDDSDIVVARQKGKELAKTCGFSSSNITLIATAISELARNILEYADTGEVTLSIVQDNGKQGVEVVARDSGPGIADIPLAMQDGYSSGRGLGLGLPGTKRLMDEFCIESAPGKGTTIVTRKWRT